MSSHLPYYVPASSKLPFAMAVTMLTLIIGASITLKPDLGPFGENSYLIFDDVDHDVLLVFSSHKGKQ